MALDFHWSGLEFHRPSSLERQWNFAGVAGSLAGFSVSGMLFALEWRVIFGGAALGFSLERQLWRRAFAFGSCGKLHQLGKAPFCCPSEPWENAGTPWEFAGLTMVSLTIGGFITGNNGFDTALFKAVYDVAH